MLKQLSTLLKQLSRSMVTKPEKQNERATLQMVATLAQVSTSTVSLVLAGKASHRRISEDTRARVKKIADDLNYAPNLLTRSLRRGRTNILSFFSTFRHRETDDLYMDKMSSAIETAGGDCGYDILVHCNFNRSPREIYQFLNGGMADGLLLFAPQHDDPLLPLLRNSNLPVVIVNGRDPEGEYPSVADDATLGMRLVADQLLANGHRRIAIFSGRQPEARDAFARAQALQAFLREAGSPIPPEWVLECGSDEATEILAKLMSSSEPPTAIFCWHDRLAYAVLAACDQLGIEVPEQLSIIGYDGLHWPSATRHVASSIQVDFNALALKAVRLLDLYIAGYAGAPLQETLPVAFVPGTSLGPANQLQRSKT